MLDIEGRVIDFDDLGLCEMGAGPIGGPRDPDGCPHKATIITEEGYRWCQEHGESWYACCAIIEKSGRKLV